MVVFFGALGLLAYFFGGRVSRRLTENREERERRETEALVSRMETYAVCGRTPERRPVTARLIYSGVKRAICRTYSR